MIDTIVLDLTRDQFKIIDPDKFLPSAHWINNLSTEFSVQSKQNPTKKELIKGIYKPKLTLSNRVNLLGKYDQY